jgi:RimJ/RimL family protein N-acetyltransferase
MMSLVSVSQINLSKPLAEDKVTTALASVLGIDSGQFLAETAQWCQAHDAISFAIMVDGYEAVGQLSISNLKGQGRIGYWLAEAHRGKGIMTEAFALALNIARSRGLNSVSGEIPVGAVASERLWHRHGAKRQGREFTITL